MSENYWDEKCKIKIFDPEGKLVAIRYTRRAALDLAVKLSGPLWMTGMSHYTEEES